MGSRTSSRKGAVALFLAATAAFLIARQVSAEQGLGDVNVQGSWAYTERSKDAEVEHLAATRAAEDAVWLMLACRADGQLRVSLVHSEQFPFPLKPLFLVKLQSNNVLTALFEAKSIEYNQILIAPLLMRHIMPLLMQEDEIVVSVPERDGAVHDYTFSMQPNDFALRPIRSCFDFD
jgi:VCBS repeat-containing protein